jgi:Uma2 family endonuclease
MTDTTLAALDLELPSIELPEEDGEVLETYQHVLQMGLLITLLRYAWRERRDFFAAGNIFIYYSLVQARDVISELEQGVSPGPRTAFRGPDFFVVLNLDDPSPRRKWVVWEEQGRYPNVIVELLSDSTAETDLTTKKDLYERTFRTSEYFVWDPLDPTAFAGWRLTEGSYQPIAPNEQGWRWSEQLGMWLGPWGGSVFGAQDVWLRYYDREG